MTAPNQTKGYDVAQVQQYTPEQMQLFQMLMSNLGGLEGGLGLLNQLAVGDEEAFQKMEAPYYSALEKGLGQTASRFSQYGAQGSSAFEQAVAGQSQDMAEKLGAQRTQMQQSALDKLLGLSGQLLGQKPYETMLEEGMDYEKLAAAGMQMLPQILALLSGNPAAAAGAGAAGAAATGGLK